MYSIRHKQTTHPHPETPSDVLRFSNEVMLNELAKTQQIDMQKDNVKPDLLSKYRLGQFHPELSGQTKGQDFLYQQDLVEYKYGHDNFQKKGLIGTFHNFPQVIPPPKEQFDTRQSRIIDSQLNREVDVSGIIYKVGDLPRGKPKIISY